MWGCNPLLAQARVAENRVYVVSSTFMAPQANWMISAVYDPSGKVLAKGETWGTVAVAEVDLGRPVVGPWNLGDFPSMVARHRPAKVPAAAPDGPAGPGALGRLAQPLAHAPATRRPEG